jgi:hypothetical protein
MLVARPYDHGNSPAGDAHLLHLKAAIGNSAAKPAPIPHPAFGQ